MKKSIWILISSSLVLLLTGCAGFLTPTYKIGIDPRWYPLDMQGKENSLVAFSTELLEEIAARQKIKISLAYSGWDNLFDDLEAGKTAAVLSSLQPQLFLEKRYSFSDLYLPLGPVLIVPLASHATTLTAMKGKEVAIVTGSPSELLLEPVGALIRSYPSIPDALNAVARGDNDGALIDILAAQSYTQDLFRSTLKIASAPLDTNGLRLVAIVDEEPELIEAFDAGLKELKKDGTYNRLAQKWHLPASS